MNARNVHLNTVKNRNEAGVGDSDRLSDQIFASTRVQAKVHLDNGTVQLRTESLADFYVARAMLVERGMRRDAIFRSV